jgi:hypothetical protein
MMFVQYSGLCCNFAWENLDCLGCGMMLMLVMLLMMDLESPNDPFVLTATVIVVVGLIS